MSSVAGSPPFSKASETAAAGVGPEVADHRVILTKSGSRRSEEEEHGGRAHDGHHELVRKQLEQASPDFLRVMQDFAEALMGGAEADALGGAPYGERSP